MSKTFYIAGIVLSLVLVYVCGYYFEETDNMTDYPAYVANNSKPYWDFNDYYGNASSTKEAGIVIVFFLLAFVSVHLIGLIRVKTKTCVILSIIGLVATGIFIVWDAIMISDPFKIGFNEVGPAFFLYALTMLAFSVTGLVQSVRFQRYGSTFGNAREDLLDS
jgi:hypothetical protein